MATDGARNRRGGALRRALGLRARSPANVGALALLLISVAACATDRVSGPVTESNDWRPGTAAHEIMVGGVKRSFLLHVPPGFVGRVQEVDAPSNPTYPLVLVLHGSSGSGEAIRGSSQMDSLSDAIGFLVAYPNASEGGFGLYPSDWNAGTCCGAAFRENVDDLSFISALIARVGAQLPVDQARIYVAGFSDGGRMAYHVACQLSSRIAAIAVVSGSLVDDQCFPGSAVPVLAIHGTADDQVAYDDNASTPAPGPVPEMASDLPSSVQFWIAQNGCGDGSITRLSDHVVQTSFGPCSGGDVVLYTIEGGSHGWPGEPGSDPPMTELQASDLIAQFFSRQVRR